MHTVRMFYGNEKLEETVRIFLGYGVIITAHSRGQRNILFMQSGASVIELRSSSWQVTWFVNLGKCSNLNDFTYMDFNGNQKSELDFDIRESIPVSV